jgi:hypothetical protein
VLLPELLTQENRQKRQINFPQNSFVVFWGNEDLIMIGCIGFEELSCFVAMSLFFVSGSISFDSSYFDHLGWVFGRFSFSVLELDVVLISL